MTQPQTKDSIAQNWFSFLDTNSSRRVFIFDFNFISTTPGIDDFVKMLASNNVTPIVISHWPATADFGTLLNSEFQKPIDLPTFNLEPGADMSVGDLVDIARGREITGCASDFLLDTSLAKATCRAGGIVFTCRDDQAHAFVTDLTLPFDAIKVTDLNQARVHPYLQQRYAGC